MTKKNKPKNLPDTVTDNALEVTDDKHTPIPIAAMLELRSKGLSCQQVADLLGCSKTNVVKRLGPFREELATLPIFKKNKADVLEVIQAKILNSFTESDIKEMKGRDRVVAAGILYDKVRLETGQSTTNQAIICRWIGENEDGSFSDD